MPEAHGYIICQETLEALRLVKDELNQVSGVFNFDIIRSVGWSNRKKSTWKERTCVKEKRPWRNYSKGYKWKRKPICQQKDRPM